jgi:transcriptional regulator with XRE-family HTH domain
MKMRRRKVQMTSEKKPNLALRRERDLRGWSQRRVAEEVDTSASIVSRWERGERVPEPHYREKLCKLFGKNAEELGFPVTSSQSQSTPIQQAVSALNLDASLFEHPDFKRGMTVGREMSKESRMTQLAKGEPVPFLVHLGVVMGMIDEAMAVGASGI